MKNYILQFRTDMLANIRWQTVAWRSKIKRIVMLRWLILRTFTLINFRSKASCNYSQPVELIALRVGDIFILKSVDLERLTGIFLISRLNCERFPSYFEKECRFPFRYKLKGAKPTSSFLFKTTPETRSLMGSLHWQHWQPRLSVFKTRQDWKKM